MNALPLDPPRLIDVAVPANRGCGLKMAALLVLGKRISNRQTDLPPTEEDTMKPYLHERLK